MFVIIHYCLNRLSLKIFCSIAKWEEKVSSNQTLSPKVLHLYNQIKNTRSVILNPLSKIVEQHIIYL